MHTREAIRRRPGMYIGDIRDGSGLVHMLWEVVANSLDEHLAGHCDRIAIEVGYSAYAFGGVLDQARLDTMTSYDPRGDAPPPAPDSALAGGEQHGMIDLAIGVGM